MRVLIVEDEPKLAGLLRKGLTAQGLAADLASDADEAMWMATATAYDAITLDVMLPGTDGFTLCREFRRHGVTTPVLMITALDTIHDRVTGLDSGADDYLAKPFRMEELIARVRALIRRSVGQGAPVMEAGELSLDTRHMRILRRGVPVSLSPLEYRLLAYLIHQQGRVVPPGELIEHLYGDGDAREANALEAVIARLRRKVGANAIETRRGFGYVLGGDSV